MIIKGKLLILFSILFLSYCSKSPTDNLENNNENSKINLSISQYQNDTGFVDLGEFDFNVDQLINLQTTAKKDISFQSNAITIHTTSKNSAGLDPEIFIILENDLDTIYTYKTICQKLNSYTSMMASMPNVQNFSGTIYAFLINKIEDQIEDPIQLTIKAENLNDTLTIYPDQHTFDLNESFSIASNKLNFNGVENIQISLKNESDRSCGMIFNCDYKENYGLFWRLTILPNGKGTSYSVGGYPLSEDFKFYGFKLK